MQCSGCWCNPHDEDSKFWRLNLGGVVSAHPRARTEEFIGLNLA